MAYDLDRKKEYIERYVRLGMSPLKSMITAECSDDEITKLEADQMFMRKLKTLDGLEEVRLLEAFETCLDQTSKAGDSKDVKWKLSKIDPERFGDASRVAVSSDKAGLNFTFNLVGGKDLLNDENIEEHKASKEFLEGGK